MIASSGSDLVLGSRCLGADFMVAQRCTWLFTKSGSCPGSLQPKSPGRTAGSGTDGITEDYLCCSLLKRRWDKFDKENAKLWKEFSNSGTSVRHSSVVRQLRFRGCFGGQQAQQSECLPPKRLPGVCAGDHWWLCGVPMSDLHL